MTPYDPHAPLQERVRALAGEMRQWGLLEDPAPPAALRWIETFLEAYGCELSGYEDAQIRVAALRAEATMIPALELERLRTREVLFFLDSVAQYVDAQPELRGLPLKHDLDAIAQEFGLSAQDAAAAVRMALTGEKTGPSMELIFRLLGHDRNSHSHRGGQLKTFTRARPGTACVWPRRQTLRARARPTPFGC